MRHLWRILWINHETFMTDTMGQPWDIYDGYYGSTMRHLWWIIWINHVTFMVDTMDQPCGIYGWKYGSTMWHLWWLLFTLDYLSNWIASYTCNNSWTENLKVPLVRQTQSLVEVKDNHQIQASQYIPLRSAMTWSRLSSAWSCIFMASVGSLSLKLADIDGSSPLCLTWSSYLHHDTVT